MLQNFSASFAALALAIATTVALAQSAHVHGKGRVNIAIDGSRMFLALESPGADIVGFEHQARSLDEKEAVASAIDRLGEPMQMLRISPAAGCRVVQAAAAIESSEEVSDSDANQAHEHNDDEHHGDEPHDDEHRGEMVPAGETHAAFTAEYELLCADIDALNLIEFTYFDHFANARLLDIVLIDNRGQRRVEINRADPALRFDR